LKINKGSDDYKNKKKSTPIQEIENHNNYNNKKNNGMVSCNCFQETKKNMMSICHKGGKRNCKSWLQK